MQCNRPLQAWVLFLKKFEVPCELTQGINVRNVTNSNITENNTGKGRRNTFHT